MELNAKNIRRIFLGVAGCIVLYWLLNEPEGLLSLLYGVTSLFSPFIVGAALAFVLNVPMRGIESLLKKIPKTSLRRMLAIVMTLLAVVLVLYGVINLLIPQIGETVQSIATRLPVFFEKVQEEVTKYLEKNPEVTQWLTEYTDFESVDWNSVIQKAVNLVTDSIGGIVYTAITTVVSLSTGVFNAILSLAFAVYALARKEVLARQGRRLLYSFLPERVGDEVVRILRMTNKTFSKFISGQCLEALILGLMFAVAMPIFGMPYVVLISVVIAVTALVPIEGAFVGCIIGAFFILVVDPAMAFWFVLLFLALQQIEGNLIYPRVVGSSVGLPGMWVLVAVAIGGDLMGVGGMLLMIPMVSVCYALAREITEKRLAARNIPREKLRDQPMDPDVPKERPAKKKKQKKTEAENSKKA